MCMRQNNLILALVIPGPDHPGKNLNVFMQPLIDEIDDLWKNGALTYDCHSKENFNMKAALLWTIHDFPVYGLVACWSTHGKLATRQYLKRTTGKDQGLAGAWQHTHKLKRGNNRGQMCSQKTADRWALTNQGGLDFDALMREGAQHEPGTYDSECECYSDNDGHDGADLGTGNDIEAGDNNLDDEEYDWANFK